MTVHNLTAAFFASDSRDSSVLDLIVISQTLLMLCALFVAGKVQERDGEQPAV